MTFPAQIIGGVRINGTWLPAKMTCNREEAVKRATARAPSKLASLRPTYRPLIPTHHQTTIIAQAATLAEARLVTVSGNENGGAANGTTNQIVSVIQTVLAAQVECLGMEQKRRAASHDELALQHLRALIVFSRIFALCFRRDSLSDYGTSVFGMCSTDSL